MFRAEILSEAMKKAKKELKKVFKQYGPAKVKHQDLPKELNPDEVEFRQEGCQNDKGDIYVGEFRKGKLFRIDIHSFQAEVAG